MVSVQVLVTRPSVVHATPRLHALKKGWIFYKCGTGFTCPASAADRCHVSMMMHVKNPIFFHRSKALCASSRFVCPSIALIYVVNVCAEYVHVLAHSLIQTYALLLIF